MSFKLLEEVKANGQPLVIPFKKYRLHNGLTVIIHPDHSNPLVHVDITYHVGSGREVVGKSGFAHFFEHMMFDGSKHVANNEHFRLISEAGGTLNGTTNRDRTNYFETLPKNQLDLALWLESDRMGFLLDAVTQKGFENQRNVIKNEKAQRYENQPYGMLSEITQEHLYPKNHPYSWTTIGYTEDLDRVTLNDLRAFFKKWYGPNNATLTIGGDVNVEEALEKVEKYFGKIPSGQKVEKPVYEQPKLQRDSYVRYEDKVRFPMLQITLPTVPVYFEDEAALDVLADILGNGKNALLYTPFVKERKAVQVYANNICYEGAGEFRIGLFAYPNQSLVDLEIETHSILENLANNGVNELDLKRAKNKYYSRLLYGIESVKNKVSRLANYEIFAPETNYVAKDAERYKELTVEDVNRVFKKYIYKQPKLNVVFYNNESKDSIPEKDYASFQRDLPEVIEHEEELVEQPVIKEDFDRSEKPVAGPSPHITAPEIYQKEFKNGLRMALTHQEESPTLSMLLSFKGGSTTDPVGKCGRLTLMSRMLKESSHKLSSELISEKLESLGSSISVSNTKEELQVSVKTLRENREQTFEILQELLLHPAFKKEELARIKHEHKEFLAFQNDETDILANRAFYQAMYGENHPMGRPLSGRMEDIDSITSDDLREAYKQLVMPNNARLSISGHINASEIESELNFLMNPWQKGELPAVDVPQAEYKSAGKIILVHKDNAPQSEIRIGKPGLPFDATGLFYKLGIMNYPLGLSFNSRINLNLREDKGYTYGARSIFQGGYFAGPFVASAAVVAKDTAAAVIEFLKEIDDFRANGMSEGELDFTKRSILSQDALKYETNGQKTRYLAKMLKYNLPANFLEEQKDILDRIGLEELNLLANQHLDSAEMTIVVAGDKEKLLKPLSEISAFSLELIESTANA